MKNYAFLAFFLSVSCYASCYYEEYEYRRLYQLSATYGEYVEKNEIEKQDDDIKEEIVKKPIKEDKNIIYGYFSIPYYSEKYQIPEESALDHYIQEGAQKGFFPHPAFDPKWYLECFPESESPFTDWLSKDYWIKFRKERNLKTEDLNRIQEPAYPWDEKEFKPKEKFFKNYLFNRKDLTKTIIHSLYNESCEDINPYCNQMMLLSRIIGADPLKSLYRKKKDLQEHRMWITSLSQPVEPPEENIKKWIKSLKKTNLKSHFWCLRSSDLPNTVAFLKENNIEIHEISELGRMKGADIAYALYRNHQYTLSSDIIRFNIIYQKGGIYSDIGYEYLTDPSYLCEIYDYIFFHMYDSFFDRNFFFAPQKNYLIEQYLNKIDKTNWLIEIVEKNKIECRNQQLFILGCALLNINFNVYRKPEESVFLICDNTVIKTNRMNSWYSKSLFGNKTIFDEGPKIFDLAHYVYEPHVENPYVVMTMGTLDLPHKGHLEILRRAKNVGESEVFGEVAFLGQKYPPKVELHVGISTDEFTYKKKNRYPIMSQDDRKDIIGSMKWVDKTFFEESMEEKPNYLKNADWFVMGDDWKKKFDDLTTNKTAISYLPRTPGISTTDLIQKIKNMETINYTQIQILNPTGPLYKFVNGREDYHKSVYQVAFDMQNILVKSGVKFFFTSGTLLGIIRSGGLFQWDDDLDVNLLDPTEVQINFLKNAIVNQGYLFKDSVHGWKGYQILKMNENKEMKGYCDFFIAHKKENGFYKFPSGWPTYTFSDDEVFPTKFGKYGETFLTIPNLYHVILHKNFGDNYFSHVKKYNHVFSETKKEAKLALMQKGEELPAGPF